MQDEQCGWLEKNGYEQVTDEDVLSILRNNQDGLKREITLKNLQIQKLSEQAVEEKKLAENYSKNIENFEEDK